MTAALCRSCGAQPRPEAKFCDECGGALGRDAGLAEYKQVTVLFADVVHSMDIAAALGAERLREVMTQVFTRSAAMVERHGGTVDKFTGRRADGREERFALNIVPFLDTYLALSMAEQGHVNLAVERLWTLTDEMLRDGHLANVEVTLAFLAQILLSQGRIDEAGSAIERLVAVNRELRWATRDVAVLGLRARLALADGRGEDSTYRELRDRYRAMANDLGFEGHMAWAHAMP
ncbi:MAG: adenylate cyclase [Mycobacterium sp.]|jgi:class 3 adenylate cyclase|nr:adenylate cyclase [Mycobacterium sp.]